MNGNRIYRAKTYLENELVSTRRFLPCRSIDILQVHFYHSEEIKHETDEMPFDDALRFQNFIVSGHTLRILS